MNQTFRPSGLRHHRMYGHLVEYDKASEEDEDTCPQDGRHLECGRKFVVDCYEVTFHSRLPEEQWNQVVSTAMGDSVYVTAGKNRGGIQDYDIVREERRRCHD